MSKNEFLDKLKHALGNDLNSAAVQEHVNYYASYIDGEMAKGRSEAEVVDELGDPWAISRNIVGMQHVDEIDSDSRSKTRERKKPEGSKAHVFTFDTRGKRIALVVAIVVAIVLVMSIVSSIISFLMPVLLPILVVLWVVRMVRRRRG